MTVETFNTMQLLKNKFCENCKYNTISLPEDPLYRYCTKNSIGARVSDLPQMKKDWCCDDWESYS